MVIKYSFPGPDDEDIEQMVDYGDIVETASGYPAAECVIRPAGANGIVLKAVQSDEFGNESIIEVFLEASDLDKINAFLK